MGIPPVDTGSLRNGAERDRKNPIDAKFSCHHVYSGTAPNGAWNYEILTAARKKFTLSFSPALDQQAPLQSKDTEMVRLRVTVVTPRNAPSYSAFIIRCDTWSRNLRGAIRYPLASNVFRSPEITVGVDLSMAPIAVSTTC